MAGWKVDGDKKEFNMEMNVVGEDERNELRDDGWKSCVTVDDPQFNIIISSSVFASSYSMVRVS